MTARRIITLLGLLCVIASCMSNPISQPQPVRLTLWHAYGGLLGEQFESLVTEFNESHPGIIVEPAYGGDLWTMRDKLFVSIAGDAGPDLAQIDQFWSSELADAGAILPLEEYLDSASQFDRTGFWAQAWDTASYQDTIWSMPFSLSHIALYYNRSLFSQAGLDPDSPPASWQELERTAALLSQDTDGDGAMDQWGLSFPVRADQGVVYYWIAFLWQAGGEILSPDETASRFHEAAGVRALAFWQRMAADGSVPLTPPEAGFEKGQIAMILASTARLSQYIEALGDDLAIAPLPCGERCATGIGGANLAVFASCEHPQEAWQFIEWMSSPSINLRWSMETGYLPLHRDVVASEAYRKYVADDGRVAIILEQMKVARARPNIPAYSALSRELGFAVESALFGSVDPQEALTEAAERSSILLAP